MPGLAFARAMRSATVLNGESGTTLMTNGYDVSMETIAMSLSGSKGIDFSIAG